MDMGQDDMEDEGVSCQEASVVLQRLKTLQSLVLVN